MEKKPGPKTVEVHRQQIRQVLEYIQQHLERDLSIGELAHVASSSEFHFHRIFRDIIGEPVAEHVRRLRLERAALELYYTDRPIKQIAAEVGYASHEAFTRAFVSQLGASPAQYRARLAVPWGSSLENVQYSPEETAGWEPFRLEERIRSIEIKEIAPVRVAYLRALGPYKTSFASAWEKFGAWLHGRGFTGAGLRKYNIALDNPDVTSPDKLRGDVCIEVDDAFQPEGEVGVQIIPGGLYAVATHVGPWTLVGLAWHWLFNVWLPRSGKHFRLAPAYDQFRCGAETPLEEWVVEIHVPVELPTR